ncbi:hypothetical protein J4460_01400 [Candidatus Woesearchaeota archaeon]|nr:MAG: Transcriptional regulator TrmB [archaeon GW2011_AR4]MBS3129306.1 hypothetical protein [Candidatus Woesearchaeota archaeon]HIH38609.1 hypothetical protein [Candidatus Woesearchaeota archaeon]HIH49452.1 hypothetical protein [Candidatus Woesearchaeota archaeon]HIJ02813.1 hypothetical protein [Candidatus Woesearchaeota archaeon]
MDASALEQIGLTKNEIKVYLALLRLGSGSAGAIIDKAHVHNSVLHANLHSLIQKGFVAFIIKGKARVYQAAPPETILDYVDEKKNEISRLLPHLHQLQTLGAEKQHAEIFSGIKGVSTLLYQLIEETKPKNEFLFFSADVDLHNELIQKFYTRYDAKRKEKKLIVKGIAPVKLRPLFAQRRYLRMKYVKFPIPENTGICNDKMGIISWEPEPSGILITSSLIVQKQRAFFNQIWGNMDDYYTP